MNTTKYAVVLRCDPDSPGQIYEAVHVNCVFPDERLDTLPQFDSFSAACNEARRLNRNSPFVTRKSA